MEMVEREVDGEPPLTRSLTFRKEHPGEMVCWFNLKTYKVYKVYKALIHISLNIGKVGTNGFGDSESSCRADEIQRITFVKGDTIKPNKQND
jgi:hypothetical protein